MSKTLLRVRLGAALLCVGAATAHAQISLTTAVDLALHNSPRVKMSEAEVTKARAVLSESKDIFVPAVTAGAGLGQSYGYSANPPTLFNMTGQSLIYNASQFSYIKSARSGIDAAQDSLEDARESVAEDAALTFLAVDHDQQREAVLHQEAEYSARLLAIVQDRLDAGQDSRVDLTEAKLAAARLHLAVLRAENDSANDRAHLARLMGIPAGTLRTEGGFPAAPLTAETFTTTDGYASPAVAAAFQTAKAKQLQAYGDAHALYRPQFSLIVQYNRYATFTNTFKALKDSSNIGANEGVFGVQITIPLYDRFRRDKNVESAADATRALHEAEFAQVNALDGQGKLRNAIALLEAQAQVSALELERAQEQLEDIQQRLTAPANGPPLTPKDEQNARISEREKALAVLDNTFQLHQNEVSLLRQMGHLVYWLEHAGLSAPVPAPSTKQPNP